jgi:phage baseplate assembly protein V
MFREDLPAEFEEMLRFGVVKSVDLATGRVVVAVGEIETDDIRWLERRAGATRTWSPPSVGEQILLLCPSGEIAGAVALGGLSKEEFPPAGDSLRELVRFADGAVIAYDPEAHRLDLELPEDATINVTSPGGVTINTEAGVTISAASGVTVTGDLTVDGDIYCTGQGLAREDWIVWAVPEE